MLAVATAPIYEVFTTDLLTRGLFHKNWFADELCGLCVCACMRERERERESAHGRGINTKNTSLD
jgi:hypothetical protein